jgi:enoyl-CoA hydratase/carnithine racemase
MSRAYALAADIDVAAPQAVAATMRVSRAAVALTDDEAWAVNDLAAQQIRLSDDAREGRRAFAEKRRPSWTGH